MIIGEVYKPQPEENRLNIHSQGSIFQLNYPGIGGIGLSRSPLVAKADLSRHSEQLAYRNRYNAGQLAGLFSQLVELGLGDLGSSISSFQLPFDLLAGQTEDLLHNIANSKFAQDNQVLLELVNYAIVSKRLAQRGSLSQQASLPAVLGLSTIEIQAGKYGLCLVMEDLSRLKDFNLVLSNYKRIGSQLHSMFLGLADAFSQIYGAGIIHKDLKAQNIRVSVNQPGQQEVKIFDWTTAVFEGNPPDAFSEAATFNLAPPEHFAVYQQVNSGFMSSREEVSAFKNRLFNEINNAAFDTYTFSMSIMQSLCNLRPHARGHLTDCGPKEISAALDRRNYAVVYNCPDSVKIKSCFTAESIEALAARFDNNWILVRKVVEILNHGCAFDPADRYASPTELCYALAEAF